jgi:non-specific serine/threonine protein kinase/serine/threonine-protein kinase
MGEVWIADQERPLRRRVALKLIKAGLDSERFIARFEAERQALALMDHANIAKVLDAGATDQGPYFVMEFVPGVPITRHCHEHSLDTQARLRLFVQVCEGVQHAHEKAIIHRDIKPSNVLVTVQDGHHIPKIIDFGIAKTLSTPLVDLVEVTQAGTLIGTLEYMSPEQLDMSGDIDTRADVYSLGVLLYELLIGALPFEAKDIPVMGIDEFRRRVREVDPARPSVRVTSITTAVAESQASARTDWGSLQKILRGELDWIVMRALEKERARRYSSPRELAADIERYLRHEPVLAAPPSRMYLLSKFVRRHRTGVAAAAVVFVAMIVGVTGMAFGLLRARAAERAATREAAKTDAVNQFLQDMLASASPAFSQGRELTVREMLDQASTKADSALHEWEIEAAVRTTIGMTYEALGHFDQARPHLESALDLRKNSLGANDPQVAQSLHNLGKLRWDATDYEGAQKLISEALAIYRQNAGSEESAAACINDLAVVLQSRGDFKSAEAKFREALDLRRKLLGNEHPDVADNLINLGWALMVNGQHEEAEAMFREGLEINRKALGEEHPNTLQSMLNLAGVLRQRGNTTEAEELSLRSLHGMRRVLGAEHHNTLRAMMSLGEMYLEIGRGKDAKPILEEALAIGERTLGPDHALTIRLLADMGWVERDRGEFASSEKYYRETWNRRTRVLGSEHPDTIRAKWQVGRALVFLGRNGDAEHVLREAVDESRKAASPGDNTSSSLLYLGLALEQQKKYAQAEPLLKEAIDLRTAGGAGATWETAYAQNALGACLGAQGKYPEGAPLVLESMKSLEEGAGAPAVHIQKARKRTEEFLAAWSRRSPREAEEARKSVKPPAEISAATR